jgi:hypothetical protein
LATPTDALANPEKYIGCQFHPLVSGAGADGAAVTTRATAASAAAITWRARFMLGTILHRHSCADA